MYQANKQPLTTNAQDGIFMLSAVGADPVVEYSHLGPAVNDGVFACKYEFLKTQNTIYR
jgi:hypothetical protein